MKEVEIHITIGDREHYRLSRNWVDEIETICEQDDTFVTRVEETKKHIILIISGKSEKALDDLVEALTYLIEKQGGNNSIEISFGQK